MNNKFYDYEKLELDGEIWKDVVGYENIYEVSNFGRIRTKLRVIFYDRNLGRGLEKKTIYPKIRKPKLNKHTGYLMVGLNGKGKSLNVTIHSMVARAFINDYGCGKKGNSKCVNHIDGNKMNNNLSNLEVVTIKENVLHAFEHRLIGTAHRVKYLGVEYRSKAEFKRITKMSESAMNKLIKAKEIEII